MSCSVPQRYQKVSQTSPTSRSDENHAQIPANSNGKPDGNLEGRANPCSPLCEVSSPNMELDTVNVSSITDFFYDDSTILYAPLPDHDINQSPCYPVIVIKQGYYYCRLHPEIKNINLESIERHIKYKDPAAHKSELSKFSKLTHN